MKIQFCGASTGVTGSCHLITTDNHRILLDCGQFQGGKAQEAMNYEEFPFDPAEIDCLILSHAHIDHCGRIPLLFKRGFKGDIYCTDATADLLGVMLKDSGYIHEKEAEWKNRKNERAGRPVIEPLYTYNDAVDSLKFVKPVLYDQLIELNEEMKIVFNDAGHILGSAITELWVTENDTVSKIVFSGDLGVMNRPILRDPTIIKKADYVIMETTYGNRLHPQNSMDVRRLMDIIRETAARGGTTVIPSFAVGRTQELIYELNRVYDSNSEYREAFKDLMVYVDSPMATTATEVFKRNAQVFDDETKEYIRKGDHPLDFKNLKFTRTSEESMWLNSDRKPKVIISASGMCEAGRIRHHLKHNLWDSRASIVFVGYQAEGTLGRRLVEGAQEVTLFGEKIKVNAQIHNLEGFSGHADRDGLLEWLGGFRQQPKHIFLVHGENDSKEDFAKTVKEQLGYEPVVVHGNSEYVLEENEIVSMRQTAEDDMDAEAANAARSTLTGIHRRIEDILYNANLAIDGKMPHDKLIKINNIIQELEKSAINLGAAVSEEDNTDTQ
ncbi:MAG: MBL fold metallo-hydrolase [Lentihominibacter sp.]|nr:MBL fold metallo-hydrolase [Clostridiales bacterium]MDY2681108.1 MBL fold metallo-hydrolase [Lentihominibacter sp.]